MYTNMYLYLCFTHKYIDIYIYINNIYIYILYIREGTHIDSRHMRLACPKQLPCNIISVKRAQIPGPRRKNKSQSLLADEPVHSRSIRGSSKLRMIHAEGGVA